MLEWLGVDPNFNWESFVEQDRVETLNRDSVLLKF